MSDPMTPAGPSGRPPRRLGFSPKLRLAPLWPALLALATLTFMALALMPGVVTDEAAADLQATTRLLGVALAQEHLAAGEPLRQRLRQLAVGGPYRLTALSLDGQVLADSAVPPAELSNLQSHADRPEFLAALARGEGVAARESATTGEETIYAARLVVDPHGDRWVLRVARPLASLAAVRAHFLQSTLVAALTALVALLVLSWWLSRSLFRPLTALVHAAERLGEGDYGAPIAIPDERELAALGRSLARIARAARARLAELAAERDHLARVLARLADGVLVTDKAGHLTVANPALQKLFGVGEAPVGRPAIEAVRHPAVAEALGQALAGAEVESRPLELADASRRAVQLAALPLGPGEGAVVVARDVTAAERLNRARRDFVANVSHELKTPLAAIRGCAETLRDGALADAEAAPRFLDRLLEQCSRLEKLVGDLLTLSRLEAPERPLERQPLDLHELAAEAIETVAATATARGVSLRLVASGSVPYRGDRAALERLLLNLIDNAIKYNRAGGQVEVSVRDEGEAALLQVSDTGVGIPPEAQARIFERFYRVDRGRSRDEGGSGLGLAIVKHIAQAHGARVELESEPNRGSTFRVHLPTAS